MYASAGLSRRVGVWRCALVPDALKPGKFYPPTAQHAIRQAAALAKNIVATMRGQPPQPFKFKMLGMLGGHWTANRGGGNPRHEVLRNYRLVALALHLPEQTSGFREESSRRARLDP